MKIRIIYISVSGNTRAFVKKLQSYGEESCEIELVEVTDFSKFSKESQPFVAFVPTYLDGGNGQDNGTNEIMTNTLKEYIDFADNQKFCLGVVGSGNKNFNWQYCLTAKQYAESFEIPFLADYELRGTPADVQRIFEVLQEVFKEQV